VLLADLEIARTKLGAQIEIGKRLLSEASGYLIDRVFNELSAREQKLREYNETLLRSLFDSDVIAKKFSNDTQVFEWAVYSRHTDWHNLREVEESHGSDPQESLRGRIEKQIKFFESLVERLDLHPRASSAVTRRTSVGGSTKIFIVHGHDKAVKESTIRFVDKLGLTPVVFDETPNKGRTIIEKFEDLAADVVFAIVLFTPDDVGGQARRSTKPQQRARQNVVFELGFFVGTLGRDRVCLLHKADTEIPSDLHGVLYVPLDEHEGWHVRLAREMKAAALSFDFNQIL